MQDAVVDHQLKHLKQKAKEIFSLPETLEKNMHCQSELTMMAEWTNSQTQYNKAAWYTSIGSKITAGAVTPFLSAAFRMIISAS